MVLKCTFFKYVGIKNVDKKVDKNEAFNLKQIAF